MKTTALAIFLIGAVTAFGQGRGGGRPSGTGQGQPADVGRPSDMGRPADAGRPADVGRPADAGTQNQQVTHEQKPLRDAQINSGAFRMLQEKTGMSSEELQDLYTSSGAKNFGQFVSAVVVSKNLGLDTNQVLEGLKTKSLGQTLKDLGVEEETVKAEIKKAKKEAKESNKKSS